MDQYKANTINTSTPEELTLMLYNGLVKFLMQAMNNVEKKEVEKAHTCIVKAQNIITEFKVTLDMKYPVSETMYLLYDYMNQRLITADIKKDNEILEEVLNLAKEFRDTWAQAMKLAKHSAPKQAIGPNTASPLAAAGLV